MATQSCTIIETCQAMRECVANLKSAGSSIGLVPTMGALHEGHLSLVRESLNITDVTIVTIFVNPTQFGPQEDLSTYPRTFEQDCEHLHQLGVEYVFAPSIAEMYPAGCTTAVAPATVARSWEGENRPTHFAGVATIVAKLFHLTQPDVAFFGQKDYQQTLVIRRMVDDLNFSTQINVCPIVRDADGLAMSSRNVYLTPAERTRAVAISRALHMARQRIEAGDRDGTAISGQMLDVLREAGIERIDYALFANAETLQAQSRIELPTVGLIAAHVGHTRLIDNLLIEK